MAEASVTPTADATTTAAGADQRSLIGAPAGNGSPAGTAGDKSSVVAENWIKGYVKEDGTLDTGRLKHLPDDRREDVGILSRFKSLDDLTKSLTHHARMAREKGLVPLREGASPEERAEHMKRLAQVNRTPDTPEGYGLKADDPALHKQYGEFAKVFHKHALSPEAVKELFELNDRVNKEAMEAYETERALAEDKAWKEQEALLSREFGPFKKEKLAAALQGARWMGLDPDSAMFKQNAALIIAAAKVGEKIGEAKFVDGHSADQGGQDPEAELAEMGSNPANKYYDVLRNPDKNPRLFEEANLRRMKLGELIAAKRARLAGGGR